ncbi:MAG: SAM-dependent methyltransferase [Planctomycetota bacterium]
MQLLKNIIVEEIRKKGKIPFAEFMRLALYHPQFGYYNSNTERVGRFGDYYTSPTVHKIFGQLIAKQLEEMWQIIGGGRFTLVEIGSNSGWLCHDIVQEIRNEYPEFYDNFQYIIVESNPNSMSRQQRLLNQTPLAGKTPAARPSACVTPDRGGDVTTAGEKTQWHTYTPDGFSFDEIQGCFLSNEFIDALPVHRVRVKNMLLKELYVGYNGSGFFEVEDEISTSALQDHLATYPLELREGREYVVNPGVSGWLRHVSERLRKGFVITIDYGYVMDDACNDANNGAAPRCFYKHTVNCDYYARIGEQDITADVNFTHVMDAGRMAGLEVTGFVRQSRYLIALGILEKLQNGIYDIHSVLKAKHLIHPEAMGDVFKVLIQHKNIEVPQLSGLRRLNSVAFA